MRSIATTLDGLAETLTDRVETLLEELPDDLECAGAAAAVEKAMLEFRKAFLAEQTARLTA